MDLPGPLCLWIVLCPLLAPGLVIYTPVNETVMLIIPECNLQDSYEVKWTKNTASLLAMRKKSKLENLNGCGCNLQANGSLLLHRGESATYNAIVYNNNGQSMCTSDITVLVQEKVDRPSIKWHCKGKAINIQCSVSNGTDPSLNIAWNNKHVTQNGSNMSTTIKEQSAKVLCIASNRVSKEQATQEINCEGWNIYLILSVAGGGVAFLIFLILVIYLVKQKPCRARDIAEDDTGLSFDPGQHNIQHRPLPELAHQPGDTSGHYSNQTPSTLHRQEVPYKPTVKKTKQKPPRPQQPPHQGPRPQETPVPQPTRPALPGNHPKEQPPRPQPRTKSKAPRQHRKIPSQKGVSK